MARIAEIVISMLVMLTLLGLVLPRTYQAEDSMVINAPIQEVFDEVNHLKNWERWSPWMKVDPAMEVLYEGPADGVGAKAVWKSNNPKVGNGHQEITHVVRCSEITLTSYKEGDYEPATTKWTFEEKEDGKTKVTWTCNGRVSYNILKKYANLTTSHRIERKIGAGLRRLRRQIEYYNKSEEE